MTTLYLIMKYLNAYVDINYGIEYTTRKSENGRVGSKELLPFGYPDVTDDELENMILDNL